MNILNLIFIFLYAYFTELVARKKGRNGTIAFILGLLIPLAIIYYYLSKPLTKKKIRFKTWEKAAVYLIITIQVTWLIIFLTAITLL